MDSIHHPSTHTRSSFPLQSNFPNLRTPPHSISKSSPTNTPLSRYVRSPKRIDPTTAYVFPRPLQGGVILGGSRDDNNWSDEWDEKLGKEIMQRCCALCPELGRAEDLQVISRNIGLRREFYFCCWVCSGSWGRLGRGMCADHCV